MKRHIKNVLNHLKVESLLEKKTDNKQCLSEKVTKDYLRIKRKKKIWLQISRINYCSKIRVLVYLEFMNKMENSDAAKPEKKERYN